MGTYMGKSSESSVVRGFERAKRNLEEVRIFGITVKDRKAESGSIEMAFFSCRATWNGEISRASYANPLLAFAKIGHAVEKAPCVAPKRAPLVT